MTILDIAQSMKGRLRDGYSTQQSGVTADGGAVEYGTAIGDSSGGYVTVVMDGSPDQSATYQFEVEVDAPVTDGDRIAYVRQGGQAKAIALETLSQVAQDAEDIATATNQHFWADTNGVHVSTDQDDPAGAQNIIMNSAGVLLRDGSDYLAAFTPSAVAFYDGNGNTADNITASFGSAGAVVGKTAEDESRAEVASDGMRIIVNAQGSDWAFAEIVTDRDEYDIPYFATTFGMRDTGTVGKDSFAVGANCVASGDLSFAAGQSAVASGNRQMAIGRYNVADATSAFIIGNGFNDNARSNALTVDWSGNITAGGEVTDGYGNKLSDPCDLSSATGTLPIASGGSGQTGTSTDTTISNIITAGTGITITEAHYCTWGKVAMLMVGLKRSTAISAGGAITIGSVKSGHRPVTDAAGGSNTLNGWLSTGGNFTARNISGSQIAANTAIYISLTYLLP